MEIGDAFGKFSGNLIGAIEVQAWTPTPVPAIWENKILVPHIATKYQTKTPQFLTSQWVVKYYTVSQKKNHLNFRHNFAICWDILHFLKHPIQD